MATPSHQVLLIYIFVLPNVNAKTLVAEWRPVVVCVGSVPPLLIVSFLCLSHDDPGSSVVVSFLECKGQFFHFPILDMA